jgi:hypothetical protein
MQRTLLGYILYILHISGAMHCGVILCRSDPEVGFPINVGGDRQLLFLPQFHMFGLSMTFLGLLRGDIIIIMRKFNMTQVLRTIEEFKVRYMALAYFAIYPFSFKKFRSIS